MRLRRIGKAEGDGFEIAISQIDLADATALSTVHTNHVLGRALKKSLIAVKGSIEVKDIKTLMGIPEFDPNYLDMRTEREKR